MHYLKIIEHMLVIRFLKEIFRLYYIHSFIADELLIIGETPYHMDDNSKMSKGFLGFFDWLRKSDERIVGIRICYLENLPYNEVLQCYQYVNPTFNKKCMEVLFEGNSYDGNISGDQDFSNNFVYKSQEGDLLFTFNLDQLTIEEVNCIVRYCEVLDRVN